MMLKSASRGRTIHFAIKLRSMCVLAEVTVLLVPITFYLW